MKLSGNTIFITGGTSGIGRALAEALHGLGNQVIISGRRKALLDAVTTANPGMASIELDVADPDSIKAAAAKLIADYPTLNVLFNNAGIMDFDNATGAIDDDLLVSTLATNLAGPIRVSAALVEHLKTQPAAAIINTTSVLAFVPLAPTAIYSATKAALHSYTLSQRYMLKDTSVRVLELAPPWVQTDLINSNNEPRAMPLAAFIAETIKGLGEALGSDDDEILVEIAKPMRNAVGPDEGAFVTAFNDAMTSAPVHA